jgi:hypothetical protein
VAHSIFSAAILPYFSAISTQTCALALARCSASSLTCFAYGLTATNINTESINTGKTKSAERIECDETRDI